MQTVEQQADSRIRTIQALMANAIPLNGGNISHACAAITALVTPTICGSMFALPNHFETRVDATDAQRYAERLIGRDMDRSDAYCVAIDGSREHGDALDVHVACGPDIFVVTVWNETREDGSKYVYGEY